MRTEWTKQQLKDSLDSVPQKIIDLCHSNEESDRILGYTILFKEYIEYCDECCIDWDKIPAIGDNNSRKLTYYCPQKNMIIILYMTFNCDVASTDHYGFNNNWANIITINI